jgi:antitoxin component YwqK of YwqJK toxin-antitoxin module
MKNIFFICLFVSCLLPSAKSQPPAISDENVSLPKENLLLNNPAGNNENFSKNREITGFHSSGEMMFRGFLKKGQLHYQWNSWYANGNRMDSGRLEKGIPDGAWQVWYENGTPQFIRTYSADKWERFQQEAARYHPRKIAYPVTELYRKNKPEAEKYLSGIRSYCIMQNCGRPGRENILQVAAGNNEEKHYHPVFEKGLLHGLYISYFSSGAVKDSGHYRNGLPEGIWVKWSDEAASYWKGHYRHGKKEKEWKLYSAEGRLMRMAYYKHGKEVWKKEMQSGTGK